MQTGTLPDIVVTATDLDRLCQALDAPARGRGARSINQLFDELDRAQVVSPAEVPPDVVTMNSQVIYRDLETGETRKVTVVYPEDAEPERLRLSVLAPIGLALLGLRVGQQIRWPLENGGTKGLEVLEVVFQPEAAGQFHL